MNRNLTFQNVDMEHIYHNCWIIRAKVLWKAQIKENAMETNTCVVYYLIRTEVITHHHI